MGGLGTEPSKVDDEQASALDVLTSGRGGLSTQMHLHPKRKSFLREKNIPDIYLLPRDVLWDGRIERVDLEMLFF